MKPDDAEFLRRHGINIDLTPLYSLSYKEWAEKAKDVITSIISNLESNSKDLSELGETGLSSTVVTAINESLFFKATNETNSRGHVDITITAPNFTGDHKFKYQGEAKIWQGPKYAIDGFDQLNGYTTGRIPIAFLIFYFHTQECDVHFKSYVDQLIQQRGGKIKLVEGRYSATEHSHFSSALLFIDHFAVHLPADTNKKT